MYCNEGWRVVKNLQNLVNILSLWMTPNVMIRRVPITFSPKLKVDASLLSWKYIFKVKNHKSFSGDASSFYCTTIANEWYFRTYSWGDFSNDVTISFTFVFWDSCILCAAYLLFCKYDTNYLFWGGVEVTDDLILFLFRYTWKKEI